MSVSKRVHFNFWKKAFSFSHFEAELFFLVFRLQQWFLTFFYSRTPNQKKNKTHVSLSKLLLAILCFFINNLKLMKIWRTPLDFSRIPGWEPLVYNVV